MGSVEWVHMGGGGEGVCVELVVLGTGRYPCRCWVAQLMVSVLPSSTLMQMAKTLSSGSCSLVVKALRAHTRCALEAASLPTLLLVQHQVMEAMNSRVLRGILVPCKKASHHDWGMGKSLWIITRVQLVLAGTVGAVAHLIHCSDAGRPEKLDSRVWKLWARTKHGT